MKGRPLTFNFEPNLGLSSQGVDSSYNMQTDMSVERGII
jgi:hypothetical protein